MNNEAVVGKSDLLKEAQLLGLKALDAMLSPLFGFFSILLLGFGCVFFTCIQVVPYDRAFDVRGQLAMSAPTVEVMLENSQNYQQSMETWNLTSGNLGVFYKTDESDLAVHYQRVKALNARLREIAAMDHSTPAFPLAIEEVRPQLSMLALGSSIMWHRYHNLLWLWIAWTVIMLVLSSRRYELSQGIYQQRRRIQMNLHR